MSVVSRDFRLWANTSTDFIYNKSISKTSTSLNKFSAGCCLFSWGITFNCYLCEMLISLRFVVYALPQVDIPYLIIDSARA